MKIGLIPMSGKPVHVGHFALITLAAKECDVVHLYVSTSDRENISGEAMKLIWQKELTKILPKNVNIEFGGIPVRKIYELIGTESENFSNNEYFIYSDDNDAEKNFPLTSLKKYAPNLEGKIKIRSIKRSSTIDISGTKMREFLSNGDKESFAKYLPRGVNSDNVWNILTTIRPISKQKKKQIKSEALLRIFIKNVIS